MIRCTTSDEEIGRALADFLQRSRNKVLYNLGVAGESAVNEARSYNGRQYTDQTANLRSSTGYIITQGGKKITLSDFNPIRPTATEAHRKGLEAARELIQGMTQPYNLTVLAAMEYAIHVKNMGYNVLDSAETAAKETFERLMRES